MAEDGRATLREVSAQLRRGYTAVPLLREVEADELTPVSAYRRLAAGEERSFLLESADGGERAGRYSFLGARPFETLSVRGGRAYAAAAGEEEAPLPGPPLRALAAWTGRWRAPRRPGLPRFTGGSVGWLSYEFAGNLEPAAGLPPSEGEEARLMAFDRAVAFDRLRQRLLLVAHVRAGRGGLARRHRAAGEALDEMEERLRRPPPPARAFPARAGAGEARARLGRAAFEAGVRRLKRHIAAGDIFQAVLSERFELDLPAPAFSVYRALRSLNPSPYLFFLDLGGETVLGASPETLVRVEDGRLETHPIAGTRPRGRDEAEDRRLERGLLASVKERAEHAMLVDLGRNDLGRVSRPGSVRVTRWMGVERYSHVMHLVSCVEGRLAPGKGPWDAFAACFPAGTVTGAPKIRAMQLLAGLEAAPRGLYAGAVAYCDFHGNLDAAIAIRSLRARGRRALVQAGAGIVADSNPAREYDEARRKAGALLEAVRRAGARP